MKLNTICSAIVAWSLALTPMSVEAKSGRWAWRMIWWSAGSLSKLFKSTPKTSPSKIPSVPYRNIRKPHYAVGPIFGATDMFHLAIWWSNLIGAATLDEKSLENIASAQFSAMINKAWENVYQDWEPEYERLESIAKRVVTMAVKWNYNPKAKDWNWQVELFNSSTPNAFCMPWGKIWFYKWLIDKLDLTDDEIWIVMAHEVAHALKEHSYKAMKSELLRSWALHTAIWVTWWSTWTLLVWMVWNHLITKGYSRENEREADSLWLELAAKAWFNPYAAVSLFDKFKKLWSSWVPDILSTHPSSIERKNNMEKQIPLVMWYYYDSPYFKR